MFDFIIYFVWFLYTYINPLPPPTIFFVKCSMLSNFWKRRIPKGLDGICALRKPYIWSTLSLRSFPNVIFEMVPMFV